MIGVGYVVALVALFTSLQCKVYAVESAGLLYPENGFLAGELTPVWLASKGPGYDTIVYERLEDGMVKRAIDYYKSPLYHGVARNRRDVVDDFKNNINQISYNMSELLKEKFYYPSVLVAMEYTQNWPADKNSQDELIFDKILYGLAYWNIIDRQLRRFRYPGVRIRIAGFVIARDDFVTPSATKVNRLGIRIPESFGRMFRWWHNLRRSNNDFRVGTHNVVAFMTNAKRLWSTAYGASEKNPNCNAKDYKELSGLMVWDDLNYDGISQTLGEMAHIMGRPKTGIRASLGPTEFTAYDMTVIKNTLKRDAGCWKQPLELHPPGPPVMAIEKEGLPPY